MVTFCPLCGYEMNGFIRWAHYPARPECDVDLLIRNGAERENDH